MKTKIIKINESNIEKHLIEEAANIIKNGGLVGFPTETVYGLGANGLNIEAVEKIFIAKGRPQDNPLILHISSIDQLRELVEEIPDIAKTCIDKFWPGPLTILFKKSNRVPEIITASLNTVAIRMPKNNIALELINLANTPIAAPSANISGRPSPTSAKHVVEDLNGKIDMIIDGGITGIGLESTVLDLSATIPTILRPGGVTEEELRQIIPDLRVDYNIDELDDFIPKSPGQKYRHYAPKSEMIVFEGTTGDIIKAINRDAKKYKKLGKNIGIMCTDETKDLYKEGLIISMGSREDKPSIASNLFNTIRLFDKSDVDIILAESVELSDLGTAIMNRIIKAASGKIKKA